MATFKKLKEEQRRQTKSTPHDSPFKIINWRIWRIQIGFHSRLYFSFHPRLKVLKHLARHTHTTGGGGRFLEMFTRTRVKAVSANLPLRAQPLIGIFLCMHVCR